MSSSTTQTKRRRQSRTVVRKHKTALIAAPPGADTTALRRVLQQVGVSAFTADELYLPGRPAAAVFQEAVRRADVVIAVVNGMLHGQSAFFVVGVAQPLKKPIFLIVEAPEAMDWVEQLGLPYLQTSLTNTEALHLGITQFLTAPPPRKQTAEDTVHQTRPIGALADELIERYRLTSKQRPKIALKAVVIEALQASGVSAFAQNELVGDAYVDLAVWCDDLEPWVRNPLVIEIKGTMPGRGDLDSLIGDVVGVMRARGVDWALVIYHQKSFDVALVSHHYPNILFISGEEFLAALRDTSFGNLVHRLRNQHVHGVS